MRQPSIAHAVNWDALPETIVHGSIKRRVFNTDQLTLIRYEFAPGSVFPRHSHPESQVTIVLSGALTFDYGHHQERHEAGSIVAIPGDLPHEGRAGSEPTVALCIFTPPKPEFGRV